MLKIEDLDAVLFDLDGVLVDSIRAWHTAFNDTLKKFGKDSITLEEFKERHWGLSLMDNMEILGLGEKGTKYCREMYTENIDKIEIFPEAKNLLYSIKKKLGLVTSTPETETEIILEKFDLDSFFNVVVTGDDVEETKPSPEPVLKACKLMQIDPRRAVFVGDNISDMEAGRKAGCVVIGLGVEGDVSIGSLSEIIDVLA